jgi:hypothetical protein
VARGKAKERDCASGARGRQRSNRPIDMCAESPHLLIRNKQTTNGSLVFVRSERILRPLAARWLVKGFEQRRASSPASP